MEPVIVTSKAHLREAVSDAVESAMKRAAAAKDEPLANRKEWLTNREAQSYLGLSKATLARYRASGRLPYSKLGNAVYYRLADVEALLDSHTVASSEAS